MPSSHPSTAVARMIQTSDAVVDPNAQESLTLRVFTEMSTLAPRLARRRRRLGRLELGLGWLRVSRHRVIWSQSYSFAANRASTTKNRSAALITASVPAWAGATMKRCSLPR
jgi:hypothetical protein